MKIIVYDTETTGLLPKKTNTSPCLENVTDYPYIVQLSYIVYDIETNTVIKIYDQIISIPDNIVISDCRFPNEIESLKRAGGNIVWVQRGILPTWYADAVSANQGNNVGLNAMKMRKIHASEWAWLGSDFDVVVDNNGTIDDLYRQSASLVVSDKISLSPSDSFFA